MNARLIRLLTGLIPVKSARRRIRRRMLDRARDAGIEKALPIVRARQAENVRRCREKMRRGEPLRVCFLVCDASMFSAEPVYVAMRKDARFAPFIAVAPRVSRGETFLRETQAKTMAVLAARYGGDVVCLYDPETRRRASLAGRADIVFTSVVYNDQTFEDYTAFPLSAFALVACITYGYGGLLRVNIDKAIFLPQIAFMWRYFVSNPDMLAAWREKNPRLSDALALSGYAKMDRLAEIPVRTDRPKTVVIAPHHSLPRAGVSDDLAISTFLLHADFFQKLPDLFPEIHFVFRPHPLLFPRLATSDWWGPEKTEAYRAAMAAHPNVEFQQGGDYFETFANSDALIHDCGSFLAEYFYTGRPQCYLLESDATVDRQFLPLGRKMLEHVCRAYTQEQILAFIREYVVAGRDPERAARDAFAAREVCVNHPHAAKSVIETVVAALA